MRCMWLPTAEAAYMHGMGYKMYLLEEACSSEQISLEPTGIFRIFIVLQKSHKISELMVTPKISKLQHKESHLIVF